MEEKRPKFVLFAFGLSLAVGLFGMAFLPPSKVPFSWGVWDFGNGYVYVSGFDEEEKHFVPIKVTKITDQKGKKVEFKHPGPGVYRILTKMSHLRFYLSADKRSRTLNVELRHKNKCDHVHVQDPFTLNCNGPKLVLVPVEGAFVVGLKSRFLLLLTMSSGQLSPVVPQGFKAIVWSMGKKQVLDFKDKPYVYGRLQASILSPLFIQLNRKNNKWCKRTLFIKPVSKRMVLDEENTRDDQWTFRIEPLEKGEGVHCFLYRFEHGELDGPSGYAYAQPYDLKVEFKRPARQGIYYLFCSFDPVIPMYQYVRRYKIVGNKARLLKEWEGDLALSTQTYKLVDSLIKTGHYDAATNLLAAYDSDPIMRPYPVVLTLKKDQKIFAEKRKKMATLLMTLIGMAFLGLIVWILFVVIRGNRGYQEFMLSQTGERVKTSWFEVGLFVFILVANLIALIYTLILVYL